MRVHRVPWMLLIISGSRDPLGFFLTLAVFHKVVSNGFVLAWHKCLLLWR